MCSTLNHLLCGCNDYRKMMLSPKGMEYFAGMFGGAKSEEEKRQNQETDEAMGAGSERMKQQMMMPLNAFVSYGRISDEQLEEMLLELNR